MQTWLQYEIQVGVGVGGREEGVLRKSKASKDRSYMCVGQR